MKAHATGLLAGLDEMSYVHLLTQAQLSVKAGTFGLWWLSGARC